MKFIFNYNNIFLIVLFTFITSLVLIPIVKKIALHVGAMDIPDARKVHDHPIPRMGGLAIYASFLLGYILFGEPTTQMISILIGSFILIVTGLFDDIKSISAKYKFLVHIIAALIVVVYGQIYFTEITFLGIHVEFNLYMSYFLSTFFIVAITNIINLIDGLDGLSGGISSIYFMTIITIAILLNKTTGLDVMLALLLLGGTLGFLAHNFPPAKIFVGDSGSYFLGFMISVIALVSYKVATLTSLIIPMVILAIPIFDTALAILRRLLKGEGIATPDKEHIHHQLLKLNFSNRTSILIIYAINIVFSIVSVLYVTGNTKASIIIYIILMIMLLYVILKTDILYSHKKNDKSR